MKERDGHDDLRALVRRSIVPYAHERIGVILFKRWFGSFRVGVGLPKRV
jgi:hypothetical protein